MKTKSKFIIIEHKAKKRGLHWDLRIKKPNSKKWLSFASSKRFPLDKEKITIVRTNDHREKDALFTGTLQKGYGAGTFRKIDGGDCIYEKVELKRHIVVVFKGSKMKGRYHIISTGVIDKVYDSTRYMFFKAKNQEK